MNRFWTSSLNSERNMMANNSHTQQESVVLAETFEHHWQQLKSILNNQTVPSGDDIVAIINLLSQMTALISIELEALASLDIDEENSQLPSLNNKYDSLLGSEPNSLGINPCLDILLSENILSHVLGSSRMPITPDQQDSLRLEQLKLYETLLDQSSARAQSLLSHQPFLKPLLELLNECCKGEVMCNESETHLVMLLNQLCSRLQENPALLEVFFKPPGSNVSSRSSSSSKPDQFIIFSILLRFLHTEGVVGGQARDALLLCMALSETHEGIGEYITGTNFCHHLATGLSGLYSRMPRCLDGPYFTDLSWYRLSNSDLIHLPEVKQFLSTLEFCDAVIQVAHRSVREHLLGLIYMGFLVPVLKPALTQSLESELICSTAYVELFIRRITEPKLLAIFLRFLFTEAHDQDTIIDIMVHRLTLQSQLSTVTLSFFETLVGLNCEDVMLWLIFRHLIPQTAFLPSQRSTIRHPDIHGRGAEKLLQLTPICCLEAKTPGSLNGFNHMTSSPASHSGGHASLPTFLVGLGRPNAEEGLAVDVASEATATADPVDYQSYLMDARKAVRDRLEATKCWQYDYDGLKPPPMNNMSSLEAMEAMKSSFCDNNNPTTTTCTSDVSTPYGSGPVSLTEEEDKEFWNLMRSDEASFKVSTAIKRMKHGGHHGGGHDNVSLSSGGWSSGQEDMISPRGDSAFRGPADDVDHSISSLGPFLDLLFEKVELMPNNNLETNLLVTSLISQLASYPHPLLRAVLIHPDIVLQPSVRGLFTAIASLRQKLDNIMPTFSGSDEAVWAAKKFLNERLSIIHPKRRDSNLSIASTITHLGHEARATKNSITAAISSMFRGPGGGSSSGSKKNSPINQSKQTAENVNKSSVSNTSSSSFNSLTFEFSKFNIEVRRYALAAVILEEWLQELAAIAQEQSVLMKEIAFQLGMAIDGGDTTTTTITTKNTNINNANVMSKTGAILENHPPVLIEKTSKS